MPLSASLTLTLALALAFAAPNADDLLEGYQRESAPFGQLRFRGGRLSSRDDRVGFVSRHLERIERRLGRSLRHEITVVFVPDRAEFARVYRGVSRRDPTEWMVGVAFPGWRLIVVREDDPFAGLRRWDQPEVTLAHELAHLVIHSSGATIPRWFDEGVAMWVSQGSIPVEDEARLSALARFGGLFSLNELTRGFPRLHHPGSIAYQQSLLMIESIVERHGEAAVPRILERLASGDPIGRAYETATGSAWGDFEGEFRTWIISRHSLFAAVASVVNFWTIITLLALVAMVVEAMRRRRFRRRLEEAEADAIED